MPSAGDQTSTPNPAGLTGSQVLQSPVVFYPTLVLGPAGECIAFRTIIAVDGNLTLELQSQNLLRSFLTTYQFCPGTQPPPAGVIPPDPGTLARQFWQQIPLPVPHPSIPPGYAITGKTAYLVTNGVLVPATYSEATPLGQLTVTAHGAYRVDWGDGTASGPYSSEGGPYPSGTITHVYEDVGPVTVTVTEAWIATWALGPAAGNLGGLQTQGTIPGYQVRQVQAVLVN